MNIRAVTLLTVVGFAGSGCANHGPAVLEDCLDDPAIMSAYSSFVSENDGNFIFTGRAFLVGGYDATANRVNCYWTTGSVAKDIFLLNYPGQCSADGNTHCTVLMNGMNQIFRPNEPESSAIPEVRSGRSEVRSGRSSESSSGGGTQVFLHLVGKFAEGMAQGLATYYANPPSQTGVVRRQRVWDDRPYRCTPSGYGYTCRR